MTNTTTHEQAVQVLQQLTAAHGQASYFKTAEVIYNDGFHCVDFKVDGEEWRAAGKNKPFIPPQINRVPICILVYG